MIAWEHYRHYGDKQLLEQQYASLVEYIDYSETQLSNYLTSNGFGDWCDPVAAPGVARIGGRGVSQYTSTTVTTSALLAHSAKLMANIATVLDQTRDSKRFDQLFNAIRHNFHQALYNPDTGHYGSQTADAMALRFDITPEPLKASVAAALNNDVLNQWKGHSSVGALGQTWLYRALSDYGYEDTALGIFTAKGYPGFAYLFDELDGTTLWERKGQFDPSLGKGPIRSLNHPFHSGYDGWFYEGLGGIRPTPDTVGFQDFELKPVFPKALDHATTRMETGYGTIHSAWFRRDEKIIWDVVIPNNTTATVTIPGMQPQTIAPGTYHYEF